MRLVRWPLLAVILLAAPPAASIETSALQNQAGASAGTELRFDVTYPPSLDPGPLTGRLFVALAPTEEPEPRIAAYNSARQRDGRVPFFTADVDTLRAGATVVVNQESIGFPYRSLNELPPGDYYAQALLNVYTEFHRADGHTVWAHMDRWEGQRWAFSPGNLHSEPVRIHLDPTKPSTVKLALSKTIPPIEVPPDTAWVKRVRIPSKILSDFWGHPFFLGATVLLPKGYDDTASVKYPVVFVQGHFSLDAPYGFVTDPPKAGPALFAQMLREAGGRRESGYEFYQAWNSDSIPRVILVTLQHPTPYFDDSYGVNSANNGPYGDAIHKELIPYLEQRFRMIAKPYARVLTGGSTGGWISLALQVHYPDFYGGTWTLFPDPVDFRRYQLINIYEDDNAFVVPNAPHGAPERPFQMTPEGQPVANVRELSRMERAQGTRGRSAGQLDIWSATYGPVGQDGYPRPLWDPVTGSIDREVATHMRDHGYDLRSYLQHNWATIGQKLVGKIRVYTGDMDHFYLAPSVYLLEDFLETTKDPYYAGQFVYGRPKKGHGWQPMTNAELIKMMADQIQRNAPAGVDSGGWWR